MYQAHLFYNFSSLVGSPIFGLVYQLMHYILPRLDFELFYEVLWSWAMFVPPNIKFWLVKDLHNYVITKKFYDVLFFLVMN